MLCYAYQFSCPGNHLTSHARAHSSCPKHRYWQKWNYRISSTYYVKALGWPLTLYKIRRDQSTIEFYQQSNCTTQTLTSSNFVEHQQSQSLQWALCYGKERSQPPRSRFYPILHLISTEVSIFLLAKSIRYQENRKNILKRKHIEMQAKRRKNKLPPSEAGYQGQSRARQAALPMWKRLNKVWLMPQQIERWRFSN